jgi:LysM repeat protein
MDPIATLSRSDAPRPVPPMASICPYLLAADGGWRASTPAREHRCTAVVPATVLAPDKQRRLCLTADHDGCATYLAATARSDEQGPAIADGARQRPGAGVRPLVRTAPLVLDHGRFAVTIPSLGSQRGLGQMALLGLMAVAFAALLMARVPAGPGSTPAGGSPRLPGGAVGAPSASVRPTTKPTKAPVAASATPSRTLVPTEAKPTPSVRPSGKPTAAPSPVAGVTTYTVKRGDTLSDIATRFGTTWQVLAQLNGIKDPGRLRIGQVLDLP